MLQSTRRGSNCTVPSSTMCEMYMGSWLHWNSCFISDTLLSHPLSHSPALRILAYTTISPARHERPAEAGALMCQHGQCTTVLTCSRQAKVTQQLFVCREQGIGMRGRTATAQAMVFAHACIWSRMLCCGANRCKHST
jgi:hypothetical protein